MKLELIKFGVPGPLSGRTYTYYETKVPEFVDLKFVDIRNEEAKMDDPLSYVNIGLCKLMKDEEGVWITDIKSDIPISAEMLLKSDGRYYPGSTGMVNANQDVIDCSVKFVYISVEENVHELLRETKLKVIGL